MERPVVDVVELLSSKEVTKICAPMVRYSKLPFRTLVRKYNCDLCFTPMIMADSFVQSVKARHNEFTTDSNDKPLIVQFAANNIKDFVNAGELVSQFCDGVDLNCGCPQRWAMQDGFGAEMLNKPQLIHDMVRELRNRIDQPFTVSVKIRLLQELKETIELCRTLEAAGVSFVTVHGRTAKQRNEPVNVEAIKNVVESLNIPVVGNGDIKSLSDLQCLHEFTGCHGVMCARGLLTNPSLFTGATTTPLSCLQDWLDIAIKSSTPFQCFHHHLVFMLEKLLPRSKRKKFNCLTSVIDVVEFLTQMFDLTAPDFTDIKGTPNIMYKDMTVDDGSYFKLSVQNTVPSFAAEVEDFCDGLCVFNY